MKKLFIIVAGFVAIMSLAACGKSDKTPKNSTVSSSLAKSSNSSSSSKAVPKGSSSSNEAATSVPSGQTFKTESGSETDLAQARMALYQAGINTAGVSDDQILQWWHDAKAQGVDFVKYAQSQMQK